MTSIIQQRVMRAMSQDPETGCIRGIEDAAFQMCRQSFFLKQQNQILQNQQSRPEESVQPKTETQTRVEEINYAQKEGTVVSLTMIYVLVLIAAIIATIFITKRLTKK